MRFEDISVICDLDYLFSHDIEYLFEELGYDKDLPNKFRKHIDWQNESDPKLDYILKKLSEKGEPEGFEDTIKNLRDKRIFVLRQGAPEMHYKNSKGEKGGWANIESEKDLLEADYLKDLIKSVLI